jgi:Tol biopolymer transport system component
MLRTGMFCLSVLMAGALLALPFAGATPSGRNGRIAFQRQDHFGNWQIATASDRLRTPKKLTTEAADSQDPVWSPDGSKLAFDSSRFDPFPGDAVWLNDVFVMNADGTGVTRLTNSGFNAYPAWSPDGSLIAFASDRGGGACPYSYSCELRIYVMRPDGSDVRQVATHPHGFARDTAPRFSPDGRRLVFTRTGTQDGVHPEGALFVVRLDGTGLRRLTPFMFWPGDGDWSPDGKRIVFFAASTNPNDPNLGAADGLGDIFVIGVDGRNLTNLTHNWTGRAESYFPVWSPDGKKILFLDNRRSAFPDRSGLATMRPDGSGRRFLSSKSAELWQPDCASLN